MRILSTWTAGAAALSTAAVLSAFVACKRQDDTPPASTAPSATAYNTAYPPGYPPPQQAPYAQPQAQPYPYPAQAPAATPGYPQPQPAPMPMPTATAPGAVPVASGQMAVPGPVAFQCTNDLPCGTHHCNTQYGKCAFPCQSAADCIAPNSCVMGLCVPGAPQAH